MSMPINATPVKDTSIRPEVAMCKAPNAGDQNNPFVKSMNDLLARLASKFQGQIDFDSVFKFIGNKNPQGIGKTDQSINIDKNTQLRFLQSVSAGHTDLRSIVTRKKEDGSTLTVTSANQVNNKGEKTAQWYRYAYENKVDDNDKAAISKLLNLKDIDTTKPMKKKDEARVLMDAKGNTTGFEFTKTISYIDKEGKTHEKKIVVQTNVKGEHQSVEIFKDGKQQNLPKNISLVANYAHQSVYESHNDNKKEFDELSNLGDYGLNPNPGIGNPSIGNPGEVTINNPNSSFAALLMQLSKQFFNKSNSDNNFQQTLDFAKYLKNGFGVDIGFGDDPKSGGDVSTPVMPSPILREVQASKL